MRVFIVGATGGVGHRVAQSLRATGHPVTAIVRRAEQAESLAGQGITPIIADVVADSVETLADGMRGSDVVLFTAGAGGRDGPEATTAVDGDGPAKVAAAAKIAGVSRFYLVSVFPEAWRDGAGKAAAAAARRPGRPGPAIVAPVDWRMLPRSRG
jgi:uncharacterized protein YbjT (DUF2867 family)